MAVHTYSMSVYTEPQEVPYCTAAYPCFSQEIISYLNCNAGSCLSATYEEDFSVHILYNCEDLRNPSQGHYIRGPTIAQGVNMPPEFGVRKIKVVDLDPGAGVRLGNGTGRYLNSRFPTLVASVYHISTLANIHT